MIWLPTLLAFENQPDFDFLVEQRFSFNVQSNVRIKYYTVKLNKNVKLKRKRQYQICVNKPPPQFYSNYLYKT